MPEGTEAPPEHATATGADTQMRESLRGTLLGKLLNPESEPDKPLFEKPAESPHSETTEKKEEKPEEKKPDPKKPEATTVLGTEKPREPEKKEPEKKEAEKSEEKPKKKIRQQQAHAAPPVDVQAVATAAATAAVAAQKEIDRAQLASREEAEIPDEVKKQAHIYEELHRENPKKYPKDLSTRMARYVRAELKYAADWEKANPGEAYDSEDAQHKAWYDANQPQIDPDDYEEARIAAKARQIISAEVEPKSQRLANEVGRAQVEPELRGLAKSLAPSILKAIVPDFDGKLTQESFEKIKEADPVAAEVATYVDDAMASAVYHGGLLWNGMEEFNQKDPGHLLAKNLFVELETQLAQIEPEDLVKEGKPWVPAARYARMSDADRAAHYTTEFSDLVNYVRTFAAPNAAKRIYDNKMNESKSLVERMAPKLGFQKSGESNLSRTNPKPPERPSHVNPMISASPSMPAGSSPPVNGAPSGSQGGNPEDIFFKRLGVR